VAIAIAESRRFAPNQGDVHGVAARLGDEDLKAIMQFALLSLVILPVLPNKLMVLCGAESTSYLAHGLSHRWISLGGYIVYKFVGEKAGIVLGGLLGGMISSTATTVTTPTQFGPQQSGGPLS
jgi:uncharacterized membrane protein (DUF4010 family)